MTARIPLTPAKQARIYAEKIRGRSLPAIATDLGCAVVTARKWWRVARDHGRTALHQRRRGRAATGILSRFAPAVTAHALALKQAHPTWGPDWVHAALARDPTLAPLPLPSRLTLWLVGLGITHRCIRPNTPTGTNGS